MGARPKPLLGGILGLLLAAVAVTLLTVLGVIAADRAVVWGAAAVGVLLGTVMLTQRTSLARKRVLTMVVVAGLAAGIAVTGISEVVGGGSLSDGCTLVATSDLETAPVSPQQTSATDPFDVSSSDTIVWTATSSSVLTDWNSAIAVRVGGFEIPLWTGTYANEAQVTELSAREDVAARVEAFEQTYGFPLTGVYHLVGTLDAVEGSCTVDLYMRVEPSHALDGFLLVGLWAVGAGVLLALLVLAWDVRGSIRDADAFAAASHGGDVQPRGRAARHSTDGEVDAAGDAVTTEPSRDERSARGRSAPARDSARGASGRRSGSRADRAGSPERSGSMVDAADGQAADGHDIVAPSENATSGPSALEGEVEAVGVSEVDGAAAADSDDAPADTGDDEGPATRDA
ncbi:hypothetical protein RN607_05360 [Demequina capsici]|uniref:Uncharacterized protein n=1 Tax=Demequina capsici TaxID=3075620 RepID=A0AA96FCN7_9MICO|nr:hypothetical protein [Demequina sp. PMTSA13]WNM28431.1 hypothetical protein RN607_05360 [Demequina sp. PMTSA13]